MASKLEKFGRGEDIDESKEGEKEMLKKAEGIKKEIDVLNPDGLELSELPLEVLKKILVQYKKLENVVLEKDESPEQLANFEKAREHWMSFYKKYDIDASSLEDIELTDKGMEVQREMAEKYGFDKMLMIPKGISPKDLVGNKEFLIFKGSDEDNQNSKESNPIYVNDDVKVSELWNEKITKPEVIFLKNKKNVDSEEDETMKRIKKDKPELLINVEDNKREGTRDHGYERIIEMEEELGLKGLSIVEAMILDREYFDKTGHHLLDWDDNNAVWLTKTKDQVKSGHSLRLYWNPGSRRWYVFLYDGTFCRDFLGSVFSRGLETQQR